MRILYLSQYFPPEAGATQARAHDMARALVAAGHAVTMICEVPNHPSGRIWPGYRGKLWARETLDGIDVLRVWVKASPRKTFWTRIAFYVSYMIAAIVAGLLCARGRHDLVYATSPPLFVGVAGVVLSLIRRRPFVLEVRDPWPDAAIAMGELRNPCAIRAARWLERRCYRRAARVVTVTEGWRDHLISAGVPRERLALIPNGTDTALFAPTDGTALRRSLDLEGRFVVLYAGLHGIAQGLDTVIEAARELGAPHDVTILLVGDGPVKSELTGRAAALGLDAVRFDPEVAREAVAAYFSMADVALVPLREAPLLDGAVPTKIFDAWACACPVLAAGGGEMRALIARADGGVTVPPGDASALADAILTLRREPERCREMGRNGRRYVTAHHDRRAQARALIALLEETA